MKNIRLALVGGETLLGKELAEVLATGVAGAKITSYSATAEGSFGEQEGEAVYIEGLKAEKLGAEDAVITAGTAEGSQRAYELARAAGGKPTVVDCTSYLENEPEARIVSESSPRAASWLLVVAHPAAMALALAFERLTRYRPIRQANVLILEPASERGQRGISELHIQTNNLLTFKPLAKQVFDTQVSFNLVARYGEQAPQKLATIEQRIERDLATLLSSGSAKGAPMPSLRLVQAPVFHGYSLSLWVEFEGDIKAGEVGESLASAQIEVRSEEEESPDNAGSAGQSGLIAGDIRIDRNNPRAVWIWIAADNLRLRADAAAQVLRSLRAEPA